MKIRFKIIVTCFLLSLSFSTASIKAQVLRDTSSLSLIKKGIDYIYNFQFTRADEIYRKLNKSFPDHPVVILYRGLLTYWENYPLLATNPAKTSYEKDVQRSIELCEEKNYPSNETEILLTNLCARGLLIEFYADNDQTLDVFSLATSTYPFIRRAFEHTSTYTDFYFFTGLYDYYREVYPDTHPLYKPLALLFPKGDRLKGLRDMNTATKNSIVLKAEAYSFLMAINLTYESNYQKAFNYSKSIHELYPSNVLFTSEYIMNLLLIKKYDEAEKIIISSSANSNNSYFLAQIAIFNGIVQEKKYHNYKLAEQYYNKGIRSIAVFGDYGNEFQAFAYFGLSRLADDSRDKHLKKTYRKMALKLATFENIDFDE